MTKSKNLSLCLVTNNYETLLPSCLQDFQEITDDIIIVDIGPEDKPKQITKITGVKAYHLPWTKDFSAVKNFCLDQAQGNWVLFLQDDENISLEDIKKIKPLLDNPNVEGYLFYINYNSKTYGIFSPVQSLRLIRNRKAYRYRYKSFEMIPDEILSNIEDCDIQIKHLSDAVLSWQFQSRIALLQEDLKEYDNDSYLKYIYGIELLNKNNLAESIVQFEKARTEANLDYLYVPHLYKCLSWALICLQEYDQALTVLKSGIDYFPFYSDLLVLRAIINKQKMQYGEALYDLDKCLKTRERPRYLLPAPEIGVPLILETIADIYEENFHYRKALDCYLEASQLASTNDYLAKIGRLSYILNDPGVIEELLGASIKEQNTERLMIIVDILFNQGEYNRIIDCVNNQQIAINNQYLLESIKEYCRNMLVAEDDDFHPIDLESPFYEILLLQRIVKSWIKGRFFEAEWLLEEIYRNTNLEHSLKAVYRFVHQTLIGQGFSFHDYTHQQYQIIQNIYENFLRQGEEKKAEVLLPVLLEEQDNDFYIELAKPWAKMDNLPIIQTIFQYISDSVKQNEFIEKITGLLIFYDLPDQAAKLKDSANIQLSSELEAALSIKCQNRNIDEWITGLSSCSIHPDSENNLPQLAIKSDQSLLDFYHSLPISNELPATGTEPNNTDLTTDDIHCQIGAYYKKNHQNNVALSAYLRALQWQPLNKIARDEVKSSIDKDQQIFLDHLFQMEWIPGGDWFSNHDNFINYIRGIISFQNQSYSQAVSFFSEINEQGICSSLISAYIAASLWLSGKETDISLADNEVTEGFISLLDCILRDYILERITEYHLKYPYSGLIVIDDKR